MPPAKVKPSDVAAEAKKTYIPYIEANFAATWPAHSYLIPDSNIMRCEAPGERKRCRMSMSSGHSVPAYTNTRTAVIEGDAVDVAIELGITIGKPDQVVLVNMANDKRAGGDWEAGKFRYESHDIQS